MGIEIKIKDSEVDCSRVLNSLEYSQDIKVEIDNTKIKNASEVLNNLEDSEVKKMVKLIENHAKTLERESEEFQRINILLNEVKNQKFSIREVLKRHIPDLLVGTMANVLGGILLK